MKQQITELNDKNELKNKKLIHAEFVIIYLNNTLIIILIYYILICI